MIIMLFDPLSAALVGGGTLLTALLRSPWAEVRAGARLAFGRGGLGAAAVSVARLEQAVERAGPYAVDPAVPEDADLDAAARLMCRADPVAEMDALFAAQRARRRAAGERACALFVDAAESAPVLGLIGTVVGLMSLFADGGAAALGGGGLATALATTLYGAVLGTLVLAPLASRLAVRLSAEDEVRQALEHRIVRLCESPAPGGSVVPWRAAA